jgi:opacity protein-like surface antigen
MNKITYALLSTTMAVGLALAGGSAYAADLVQPGVVAAPAPADTSGLYISVFGGYAFSNAVNAHSTQGDTDVSVPYDGGYLIGGAIGTHLMPNLRGEVEASYVSRGVSAGAFGSGGGTGTATGTNSTLYLLGNLWFDLDTGSAITPYIGGGIGAAVIMPNITLDPGPGFGYDTAGYAFAGQLGAGIKFQLADNISADLGYRAKGVFNASLTGSGGASNLTNVNYIDQIVQVGLNFGF